MTAILNIPVQNYIDFTDFTIYCNWRNVFLAEIWMLCGFFLIYLIEEVILIQCIPPPRAPTHPKKIGINLCECLQGMYSDGQTDPWHYFSLGCLCFHTTAPTPFF
jgi:hypothetical protein